MPKTPTQKASEKRYRTKTRKLRRQQWFQANGPCKSCASNKNLELDHIDPKTKVSARLWLWGKEKRERELAKCQVLCRKCHQSKTLIDMAPLYQQMRIIAAAKTYNTHGISAYKSRRCRCDICKSAAAASKRRYRAAKKHREILSKNLLA